MASKRKMIFYYKEMYDSTHDDKDIHPELVEQAMAKAWNTLLYSTFRKNISMLDFYAKEYTGQAAVLNATTDKYEIDLPVAIVQLPDIIAGVRAVTVDQWEDVEFVPQSQTENMLMYDSDTYNLDDVISYTVRFDKIIFNQEGTVVDLTTYDFRLNLVIPLDEYEDTDELPVPSGQDMEFQNLVMQFLMQTDLKVIENG